MSDTITDTNNDAARDAGQNVSFYQVPLGGVFTIPSRGTARYIKTTPRAARERGEQYVHSFSLDDPVRLAK